MGYAINPDGTQKWAFATGGAHASSPSIGADGTIYVGSVDGHLYALGGTPQAPTATTTPTNTPTATNTPNCGNGIIEGTEQCDDGNSSSNDACKIDCTLNVCGDGVLRTGAEQCDDGNLADGDGCESNCIFSPESASGTVGAGGIVTTDSEGDGATSADPVESTVTSPNGGAISIDESGSTGGPPSGFTFVGQQVIISAPAATPDMPLVLVFTIDASQIPPGVDQDGIEVFKDGAMVPACTGVAGVASPDPCVSSRVLLGDGDVQITCSRRPRACGPLPCARNRFAATPS